MDASTEGLPGLTEPELEILKKVFSSPLDIPAEWKAWLVSYLESNPPDLPINQSIGFDNLVKSAIDNANTAAANAQSAADAAQATADLIAVYANSGQSISGTGNTSTAGPSVAVRAGRYVIFAGADMSSQFGNGFCELSVSPSGLTVQGNAASTTSVAKAVPVTLATDQTISSTLSINGSGSVNCQISSAWLVAIRYANP